jgi:DNA adenine methylase
MGLKDEIVDMLSDMDRWTLDTIVSKSHTPGFIVSKALDELVREGVINFDGMINGHKTWRAKTKSSRSKKLDATVDSMMATRMDGCQPNDETRVVPPDGDPKSSLLSIEMPFGEGWEDEPHWILDAMGWAQREEGMLEHKSQPVGDSPIRWMGGKSKMLKDLVAWYPEHHTYVEAFGGSLKPFFAKQPSKIEVVNDFYTSLVNFWRIATLYPEDLANACNSIPASRTLHRLFQRADSTRTPWERAVMFGALIRFSFNGSPWGSFGGSPSSPATRIDPDLLKACASRLSDPGVYIENLDFRKLIQRYNKKLSQGVVFFYLDPPYYKTAGYADAFPDEWHRDLAELMIEINESGNKVLMTNSEQAADAYRRWFGGSQTDFWFEDYSVAYTVSSSADSRGAVKETIISNFKLKTSSQKKQGSLL